jgi:chloride channel 7
LIEYLEYLHHIPDSLDKIENVDQYSTPFYLNGWRAFADIPSLSLDCPTLSDFSTSVDDTLALLTALDAQLFKSLQSIQPQQHDAPGWCHQVNDNLRKVFISPPGALTRLHYDAGAAHGWLAQIQGRKLFILYPPSDTQYLYPLESEIETVQSPIDPLNPDTDKFPNLENARPVAFILQPGEAVVIPQGWWHYAVALDRSITVQRNFYHAGSNAEGLVQMVMKTAAQLRLGGNK